MLYLDILTPLKIYIFIYFLNLVATFVPLGCEKAVVYRVKQKNDML